MDLSALFSSIIGRQPAPQAYTRVTRTPVSWGSPSDGAYGEYRPSTGNIVLNKDTLPQANPNPEYMSNVLRHESVHALLPHGVIDSIMQYFKSKPWQLAQAQSGLKQLDPQASASVQGVAQEAPAYLMMGRHLGLPDNIAQEYMNRMPPDIRQKYQQLMNGGGH